MLSDVLGLMDCRISFGCLFWQHLVSPDPYKVLANRGKMRAYLARYARIDPLAWLDADVADMIEMFDYVSDIIQQENDLAHKTENG